MEISSEDLMGLPVYTQSGDHLGKIVSFDLDLESNAVSRYYVKAGPIKDLFQDQLIIDDSQVISITKEKMVVDDTTTPVPILTPAQVSM